MLPALCIYITSCLCSTQTWVSQDGHQAAYSTQPNKKKLGKQYILHQNHNSLPPQASVGRSSLAMRIPTAHKLPQLCPPRRPQALENKLPSLGWTTIPKVAVVLTMWAGTSSHVYPPLEETNWERLTGRD